jgi:hypothetical protein
MFSQPPIPPEARRPRMLCQLFAILTILLLFLSIALFPAEAPSDSPTVAQSSPTSEAPHETRSE